MIRDVTKYDVFEQSDQLVLAVCRLTGQFPKSETFGLVAQMRRAAYSIPMNLAEGAARTSHREFARFVDMALGSCEEVRYQLHLAGALGYGRSADLAKMQEQYEDVKRMLANLRSAVAKGQWHEKR